MVYYLNRRKQGKWNQFVYLLVNDQSTQEVDKTWSSKVTTT